MNKQELSQMVAEILRTMDIPEPQVKGSDYKPTQPQPAKKSTPYGDGDFVPDVTALDLRKLYLVEDAQEPGKYKKLKEKTPARLGSGKAGARYKTLTMLRFRADHAAAQDAVFSQVPEDFAGKNGLIPLQTRCKDKDEYLTRPDLGRCFDEVNEKVISSTWKGTRVMLVIGDGLSSAAIEANALDCTAAIRQGLQNEGISLDKIPFVQFCRVGASDHIGDLTGCELLCLLVGERPGLGTAESMSAYITYRPHRGIPEAKRTVISNIHRQGIHAVEAGAHIASLMTEMLRQKASGIDLRQEG